MSGRPQDLIELARRRQRAAVLARGGEYAKAAQILRKSVAVARRQGLVANAMRHARQAVALGLRAGELAGEDLVLLGITQLDANAPDAAVAAVDLIGADEAPRVLAAAALVRGMALHAAGRLPEARAALHDARRRLAALGDAGGAAVALIELGMTDAAGDPPRAELCFDHARRFALAGGLGALAATATVNLLRSLAARGRDADVVARGAEALDECAAAGEPLLGASVGLLISRSAEECGRADQAELAAARAAGDAEAASGPDAAGLRVLARLRLLELSGDAVEAGRHLEAALEIAIAAGGAEVGRLLEALAAAVAAGRVPALGWSAMSWTASRLQSSGMSDLAALARTLHRDLSGGA